MREWTQEERYRVLKDKSEIAELYKKIQMSDYRQTYHVQPITGLSSDPNGFVYHNGIWHLYYQWCPWGAVHGLKYWYHTTSTDLVYWKNEGVGIHPDTEYDNKGVHSGSGFSTDNQLLLFYTGNHRDEQWIRTPYTCVAELTEDGELVKQSEPLFGPHPDYTEHQRDPKVIYDEETGRYYILIGAQTKDLKGCVLIYSSDSLLKGWAFEGELNLVNFPKIGGMWECPSIERISGKDILVFSPQYTTLPHRGSSTNHNIYLLGKMDFSNLTFTAEGDYHHLDYGFDFYAAQFAANVRDEDKAILTAWVGLPDNHYPTESEDWEGSLIIPRELRIENNQLKQTPLSDLAKLRGESLILTNQLPRVCELELTTDGKDDLDMAFFCKEDEEGGLRVFYDAQKKECFVDRSQMQQRFNSAVGEQLTVPLHQELTKIRIFIDRSSIEFFFNDGEATFTSHLYPTETETGVKLPSEVQVKAWVLTPSVADDFVV